MRRFDFRAEDFNPSNYTLAGSALSLFELWLSILQFGLQLRKFIRIMIPSICTITINTVIRLQRIYNF
jgi:hypothetical protein